MPRVYLPPEKFSGKSVLIEGEAYHHLKNVLRMEKGDPLWVIDNSGREFWVKITEVDKKDMKGEILGVRDSSRQPLTEIILYQGLLKPDKMDLVIQKATELGVSRIVPVAATRSQIRELSPSRLQRWKRIILGACAQSFRTLAPVIEEAMSFESAVEKANQDGETWVFWENEEKDDPLKALNGHSDFSKLSIFIGPEGGLTLSEVMFSRSKGSRILTLGPQVLRSETAAIASLAISVFLVERRDRLGKEKPRQEDSWKFM